MSPSLKLTLIACAMIAGMWLLPRHQAWMRTVKGLWGEIAYQKDNLSMDTRMKNYHKGNYGAPMAVLSQNTPDAVFLLPPQEYLLVYEKNPNNWSNPYLFYYMTDKVKTVEYKALDKRATATFTALVNPQKNTLVFPSLTQDSTRQQITEMFEKVIQSVKEQKAAKAKKAN